MDIADLKESFQLIGQDLAAAFKARDVDVRAEVDAAQAEVAALSKQIEEYVLFSPYAGAC